MGLSAKFGVTFIGLPKTPIRQLKTLKSTMLAEKVGARTFKCYNAPITEFWYDNWSFL